MAFLAWEIRGQARVNSFFAIQKRNSPAPDPEFPPTGRYGSTTARRLCETDSRSSAGHWRHRIAEVFLLLGVRCAAKSNRRRCNNPAEGLWDQCDWQHRRLVGTRLYFCDPTSIPS